VFNNSKWNYGAKNIKGLATVKNIGDYDVVIALL